MVKDFIEKSVNKIKKAVIREDLLAITGDYRKAIILNQFIYWSERVADADKFIEKENEIAQSNGEETRELFYGWIYKSADEMANEIMLGLSASQVRKYIGSLVDMGYLSKRNNPKYKWDRTLQYRVNLVNIAKDLKEKGYPLSDYKITIPDSDLLNARQCAINEEQSLNQIHSDNGAIPEITTENTNNKKYYSKTTNNASTKVEERYNALFDTNKDESANTEEYDSCQVKEFINDKVDEIINALDPTQAEESQPISEIISYFCDAYYKARGKSHPAISDSAYLSIVEKLLSPIDVIYDSELRLNVAAYKAMIDRFFKTEYGKRSGKHIDYRINYFFNDKILEHLFYREFDW